MKHTICAVKDLALQAFGNPFFVRHIGVAKRSFADEVNNKDKSAIAAHPEDYELYAIGAYDDDTGKLTPNDQPILLERAVDVITKE